MNLRITLDDLYYWKEGKIINKNDQNCVIVGGGSSGIVASILLADKYKNITVIEKSSTLGGLLGSYEDDHGNHYDMGTHIPNIINIEKLDDILFGTQKEREEIKKDGKGCFMQRYAYMMVEIIYKYRYILFFVISKLSISKSV